MASVFNVSLRNVSQDFNDDFYILVKLASIMAALSVVLLIADKRSRIITRTDILVVVLLTCLTVIHFVVGGEASLLKIRMAYVYFLFYLSLRILLSQGRIFSGWAIMLIFFFFGLKEAALGISQVIGRSMSGHALYSVTGSFFNPGPFGGYIAAIGSVAFAYAVHNYKATEVALLGIWRYKKVELKDAMMVILTVISAITAVMVVVILPSSMSRSAMLGFGVSVFVAIVTVPEVKGRIMMMFNVNRKRLLLYTALSFTVVVCLVIGAYNLKRPSADGRMFMNKMSLRVISENSITGVGLGNYAWGYGMAQKEYFANGEYSESELSIADCPRYGFNEFLQLGAEAGVFTMMIFLILLVRAFGVLIKNGSAWAYGLLSLTIFALFSYPFSLPSLTILLVLFLSVAGGFEQKHINIGPRIEKTIIALFLLPVSVYVIYNTKYFKDKAEAVESWQRTKGWYMSEYYEKVVEEYPELYDRLSDNFTFLFEYGHSLNKVGEYNMSNKVLELGASLSSDPMFHNVMGNNYKALGDTGSAVEEYRTAFDMLPNRIYPLYLLAKLYYETGDSTDFIAAAKCVISFEPKIESENTKDMKKEIEEIIALEYK